MLSEEDASLRRLDFSSTHHTLIIEDKTLKDLSAQGLLSIRHARSEDLILLSLDDALGSIPTSENVATAMGYGLPVTDAHVLLKSEQSVINSYVKAYNDHIISLATRYSSRIALARVSESLRFLDENGPIIIDGVAVSTNFLPVPLPAGIYSLDGLYPNARGAAYVVRSFVQAINQGHQSTLRMPNLADYGINELF